MMVVPFLKSRLVTYVVTLENYYTKVVEMQENCLDCSQTWPKVKKVSCKILEKVGKLGSIGELV